MVLAMWQPTNAMKGQHLLVQNVELRGTYIKAGKMTFYLAASSKEWAISDTLWHTAFSPYLTVHLW